MPTKLFTVLVLILAAACAHKAGPRPTAEGQDARFAKYTPFRLTADLGGLTDRERSMLPLLIEAAELMDQAFWQQAYGDERALLSSISDPAVRRFVELNYGPWDRLDGDVPFVPGVGPKPLGATFYPQDMTKEEFERVAAESPTRGETLRSPYTVVRRDGHGKLVAVSYSEAYAAWLGPAAAKLRAAAALADDPGLKRYLELRAEALVTDDYRPSDLAWMEMKDNVVDVVIGPIENYEDKLYNAKTAFEGYVLIKDREWSARLAKYAGMLPDLQRGLPVPDEYKQEEPGTDSDLNAYDVIYYAGDCNAGAKTIAINLPNDEQVQLEKGTRRLQLKNAMRAKFDKILLPIANELIAPDQRRLISFDAFFGNTMFHEVAHGLGVKRVVGAERMVREALEDQASTLEEGKADILGLYMVTALDAQGERSATLESHYATFLAGILRSVRFGAASAHGKANMICFNFFQEMGAFSRDPATGTYRVDMQKMKQATDALSERLLRIQGKGDYPAAKSFVETHRTIGPTLEADLDRLTALRIPVDIVFEQGPKVLGL